MTSKVKILIIYAHPNKLGFCGFFLKKILTKLKKQKISFQILDLYKINFSPLLQAEEHYTSGHFTLNNETKEIQKKIQKASGLIFIYPIWWQNMPAILKGFFDRVFTPRFAFKYIGNFPHGLLKNKKAIIFSSSGAPRILTKILFKNRALKNIKKDILNFCGFKVKTFSIGSARQLNDTAKQKIEKLVKKGLQFIS